MPPAESWLALSRDDRRALLARGAAELGRPAHLLEKDLWVVWSLHALYNAKSGDALVFKGGTSLSKAYDLIKRFSEDVDLTVNVRALLGLDDGQWLPTTRSAADRLRKQVEAALPTWIVNGPMAALEAARRADGLEDRLTVEHQDAVVTVTYTPDEEHHDYVRPAVRLEFGGRATGEPAVKRMITSDLAAIAPDIMFPSVEARVMVPERTWWEKATAIHVFCLQGRLRGERQARHWHDLVMLDAAGISASAIDDQALALSVADHKAMMFREKGADGKEIAYHAAVSGALRLVPDGESRAALADDYQRMLDAGLLPIGAPSFDELLASCARIERAANAPHADD